MFSQAKKEDKEFLLLLTELIELLVKIGSVQAFDTAEGIGDIYIATEEKLKTYDYSEADQRRENVTQLLNGILCQN